MHPSRPYRAISGTGRCQSGRVDPTQNSKPPSPAVAPSPEPLSGTYVRIEPLYPKAHSAGLAAAALSNDASDWRFLPYGPFADKRTVEAWLHPLGHPGPEGPLFRTIISVDSAEPIGMAAYSRIAPAFGRIEIAHVWFGKQWRQTTAATEALYLMMAHAFDDLGNRRLEWKCDSQNVRSRQAAERLGFTHEGTFRQDMIVRGQNRDTAWFSLLDHEWPARARALRSWLEPANFDDAGQQRKPLSRRTGSATVT